MNAHVGSRRAGRVCWKDDRLQRPELLGRRQRTSTTTSSLSGVGGRRLLTPILRDLHVPLYFLLSTPNNNQELNLHCVGSATKVSASSRSSPRQDVQHIPRQPHHRRRRGDHTMQQTSIDDSFAHLSRLAQKTGVQATLILSRETGAIVRSSGLVSRDESANAESTPPASNGLNADRTDGPMPSAEHVAEIVWKFAKAAGDMLQELSNLPDDDVKLLRLRSKNKEYVIFPGIYTFPVLRSTFS